MDQTIAQTLQGFAPLSLEDLNGKAAMLERLDNKYILRAAQLQPALAAFAATFDVLEIDGKRSFTYATRYFDDAAHHGYYDHHQGRRKRCKVRVRHYLDAGFSYLEVKLKDKRDVTIKKRLRVDAPLTTLDPTCMSFIEACYQEQYGQPFGHSLAPVIAMDYDRITLVAREGGERMTIDTRLNFQSNGRMRSAPSDIFVVETKSARGNGLADKILRGLHAHPTSRCSKYCIGMAALDQVSRHNRFLPALRRMGLVSRPGEIS